MRSYDMILKDKVKKLGRRGGLALVLSTPFGMGFEHTTRFGLGLWTHYSVWALGFGHTTRFGHGHTDLLLKSGICFTTLRQY